MQLLNASKKNALAPKELETFALAAYLTGRDEESYEILERAHHEYLTRKKTPQAVRCAYWLGLMLMNAGERARSNGWMARGERLLGSEHLPDCAEKGFVFLPAALQALSRGDATNAEKLFEQIATIGDRFRDTDLTVVGRLGQGQALIQQGGVDRGLRLLDETMIIIETGKVFPVLNGIVYCAAIDACRKVWDLRRAREWTAALTRWCDAQPDIVPFRGQCLLRRAEVTQMHGEWLEALRKASDACERLKQPTAESLAAEAHYRRAEIFRLRGEFENAESSYSEAAKRGRIPQPGLALLRLTQGQLDAAETSIRNALRETKAPNLRAGLLAVATRIMIAVGQKAEASRTSDELTILANNLNSPYLIATAEYCRGAVFVAEGRFDTAIEQLQKAMSAWNALHLPYESALTRELKGLAYRQLDDKDNSGSEFNAARWIYERLEAHPDLERIDQFLDSATNQDRFGLSLRELQVLRLLASGKTNKSIASELFISGRTVDRHVSNIFVKLGVSTRSAATAFAIKNKMLDH